MEEAILSKDAILFYLGFFKKGLGVSEDCLERERLSLLEGRFAESMH